MVTTGSWVVGGDFNRSETFDPEWRRKNGKKWLRIPGSAQMLRRMRELGFTECLRKSEQDPIVPTFRHNRTKMIDHQIDHLFVSNNLMPTLQECKIGDQKIIFDEKRFLSDHLPIIAEFSESQLASQIRHSEQSCLA
jgi:exonuclease III